LDISNPDTEDLNAIFRAAHSIKGGAATFGMNDMTEITHVLESLLDKIRKADCCVTAVFQRVVCDVVECLYVRFLVAHLTGFSE